MAVKKATESKRAAAGRRKREKGRNWTTATSVRESQGPVVFETVLPEAGTVALIRRVDILRCIRRGVWPEPITMAARRLHTDGVIDWINDEARYEDNVRTTVAIAREALIVPPPELVAGDIEVKDITNEQCKPLIVDADPDDDQFVLTEPGDDPAEGEYALTPADLQWVTFQVMTSLPGPVRKFRREPDDAVASLESVAADVAPAE